MATRNPLENQIDNRNFLSPVGFKFHITKTPKTLTWKPIRRERLKEKKEKKENSIIQKIITTDK